MKAREHETIKEHAIAYKGALAMLTDARATLVVARQKQVASDPGLDCSTPREVTVAVAAYRVAKQRVDETRRAFFDAIDHAPAVRWRLIDQFVGREG